MTELSTPPERRDILDVVKILSKISTARYHTYSTLG
jgi:hypothetical protein